MLALQSFWRVFCAESNSLALWEAAYITQQWASAMTGNVCSVKAGVPRLPLLSYRLSC